MTFRMLQHPHPFYQQQPLRGPGHATIDGSVGDLVSLLPLTGDASGIRTMGLYYALKGETLSFGKPRGVSNVLNEELAEVSVENGIVRVIYKCGGAW